MNSSLCLLKHMRMEFLAQNGSFWGYFRVQIKICLISFVSSSSVQMLGTMTSNRLLSSKGIPVFLMPKLYLAAEWFGVPKVATNLVLEVGVMPEYRYSENVGDERLFYGQ